MSAFPSQEWLESAAATIAEDAEFRQSNRAFEATIRFDFGDEAYAVSVDEDDLEVHENPTYVSWDFALRAPEHTWREMLAETPPPVHHDLLGAWLRGNVTMEGDLKTAIQHLKPLKRMLVVFREVTDE